MAELAFEPRLRFYALHRVGLAAIYAAKLFLVGSLYQHQLHPPLALRADGRVGLNLWHDERPWIGRERNTLSHRWLPMGGGDKAILSRSVSDILVNTAHIAKSLTKQIRPLANEKPRLMEI